MTRKHRHETVEWADEVIRRWQRRRDLPRRQLAAALEQAVMPMVEWLNRVLIRAEAWWAKVRR